MNGVPGREDGVRKSIHDQEKEGPLSSGVGALRGNLGAVEPE